MNDYKLVVVSPFNDFKRGDQILDEHIINEIVKPENAMHEHAKHCRKVLKSEIEKQQYVAPVPVNKAPAESEPKTADAKEPDESATIKVKSIKSN